MGLPKPLLHQNTLAPGWCPYQHYDISARLSEQVQAVFVILAGAHGCPAE